MSEPYDSPFHQCRGCGEDVLEQDFDKETGYCKLCMHEEQKEA